MRNSYFCMLSKIAARAFYLPTIMLTSEEPPCKIENIRMKTLACFAALLLLSACSAKQIPLQTEYQGTIPPHPAKDAKVKLVVEAFDQDGKRYEPDTLVPHQYLKLAESGFKKSGYILSADAPTEVRITLRGRTTNGVVNNQNNLGRNLAVSAVTLGAGCGEMAHDVDAAGEVAVTQDGGTTVTKQIDMKLNETSCFSKLNPNWLANHQEAAVRTYEKAVSQHVGDVLTFVAATP